MRVAAPVLRSLRAALAACFFAAAAAPAQGPPSPPTIAVAGPTVALSVSAVSARVQLGSASAGLNTVLVYNTGSTAAYFTAGSSSATATTANTPVGPGACVAQWSGANTYVAAITASGTTTLAITQFNGAPTVSCPGSAGSGALPTGAATAANQTTQITAEQATQASAASIDSKTPAAPATAGNQTTANTSLASIDTKTPALVNGGQPAVPTAAATGGATLYSAIVPNNTAGVLIGSAGNRDAYFVGVTNNAATIAYVKLYNKATAPTCGTDTPVFRMVIPGNTGAAGFVFPFGATGADFPLGLGICVTGGIADNDTTAPAASEYLVNVGYH